MDKIGVSTEFGDFDITPIEGTEVIDGLKWSFDAEMPWGRRETVNITFPDENTMRDCIQKK